ncbi:MAG: YbaB/EbfC family nucleoid-associated protein [bacterium]
MKGLPGNMGQILKQAQQMQERMAVVEEELAALTVEGTSGGGMVAVTASGKQEILKVRINPEVVDKADVEMLEDLVLAAVNDARTKAIELASKKMGAVTGGMGGLPGLF